MTTATMHLDQPRRADASETDADPPEISKPTAETKAETDQADSLRLLPVSSLSPSPFSLRVYGDPAAETAGLLESIQERGILTPLVVAADPEGFEIVSGHRRWACAQTIGLEKVPCVIRPLPKGTARKRAILESNRQRRKTFSQLMREADELETIVAAQAKRRRLSALSRVDPAEDPVRRISDERGERALTDLRGRTDVVVARTIGIGGKDVYRQARAVWKAAESGDVRARAGVEQIDRGLKTIHAAHKDLRRRDRYSAGFKPTPYDVWSFRHDRAFGIPHPGSIPPGIVAHALHYFSAPDSLVVDPMAGGGVTLDVCQSMGRRCWAGDIRPVRNEIHRWDVADGLPAEARNCDLIFYDPPYHTMLADRYDPDSASALPWSRWLEFLNRIAEVAFESLRPGGFVALLLANQTEKDLPAGFGYLDHAFHGYKALFQAGFLPERRVSCPMDGAYLPQHVRRARVEGRMLGQVRDLIVMRKPGHGDGNR